MNLNCSGWIAALAAALSAVSCRCVSRPVAFDAAADEIAALLRLIRENGNSVWWVGNGGSAAICSHLSHDLVNKLAIRSHVLTDPALMTCMANDYGYGQAYVRSLQVLARPGDLVIAISSSGCSENILLVADFARSRELSLVTLSGFATDNPLWRHEADVALHIPSHWYGQVEIGHEALLHAIVESLWGEEQRRRS